MQELKASGVLENIYNVTPDANKAVFAIISQVDEHRIKVSLTLTSTAMREEPSVEQAKSECCSRHAPGSILLVWCLMLVKS